MFGDAMATRLVEGQSIDTGTGTGHVTGTCTGSSVPMPVSSLCSAFVELMAGSQTSNLAGPQTSELEIGIAAAEIFLQGAVLLFGAQISSQMIGRHRFDVELIRI